MLSIRTQDRMALVPYNKIIFIVQFSNGWRIDTPNEEKLGIYATKERALEVLDEIQQYLVESDTTQYEYINGYSDEKVEYTYKSRTVYQMPNE